MGPQRWREILTAQGRVDESGDITQAVASVVTNPTELDRPDRGTLACHLSDRIRQPDLAAPARPVDPASIVPELTASLDAWFSLNDRGEDTVRIEPPQ